MPLFISCFIGNLHGYEINQIKGISDPIYNARFDSESNLYLQATNGLLYKLDSKKNILWNLDLKEPMNGIKSTLYCTGMEFSKQNDLYIGCDILSSNFDEYISLGIVWANTSKIDVFDTFSSDYPLSKILLDEEDNLFYYNFATLNNLKVLKSRARSPVSVANLQDLQVDKLLLDQEGNVYGFGRNEDGTFSNFFVITKDAKQEDVPEAQIVDVFDNGQTGLIFSSIVDSQNHVLVSIFDDKGNGIVKKLSDGALTTVLTKKIFRFKFSFER